METVWKFETRNFTIALEVDDCIDDPADDFADQETVEAIRAGVYNWFDARVSVYKNGHRIGSDTLGHCSYRSIEEFVSGHRNPDPSYRNTLAMKAKNVTICHYFPDMVSMAIADARRTLGE